MALKGWLRFRKEGDPNDFDKAVCRLRLIWQQRETQGPSRKPTKRQWPRAVGRPMKALEALNAIRGLTHGLTSQKELEAAFKARVKELGYTYDAKAKAYVEKGE